MSSAVAHDRLSVVLVLTRAKATAGLWAQDFQEEVAVL